MILAVDIGNTNVTCGVYDGEKWGHTLRLPSTVKSCACWTGTVTTGATGGEGSEGSGLPLQAKHPRAITHGKRNTRDSATRTVDVEVDSVSVVVVVRVTCAVAVSHLKGEGHLHGVGASVARACRVEGHRRADRGVIGQRASA